MIQDIYNNIDTLDLPVSVKGATLTVAPGEFSLLGRSLALTEEEHFTCTLREKDTYVTGWLVEADSEIRLFVDEEVDDGVDMAYDFRNSPLKVLFKIFLVTVPAGVSSLEGLDLISYRVIKPQEDQGV